MRINEHLSFSWGHIIAFVALIFIGYITFLGHMYLNGGDFVLAVAAMLASELVLLALFIRMQVLKATDHKFSRRIHGERALVFLSPFIFLFLMVPYMHFWNVYEQRSEIEHGFSTTISNAKKLFVNYEQYSNNRLAQLDEQLGIKAGDQDKPSSDSPSNKKDRKKEQNKPANTNKTKERHNANLREALQLQLLGTNYTTLRNASYEWIETASSATVWNVFMIGNLEIITDAFTAWNGALVELSRKRLSVEKNIKPFDANGTNVKNISRGFVNVRQLYKQNAIAEWPVWLGVLGLYICLLLPYLIQQRNTKSLYYLFYKRSNHSDDTFELDEPTSKGEQTRDTRSGKQQEEKPVGDYDSFTM